MCETLPPPDQEYTSHSGIHKNTQARRQLVNNFDRNYYNMPFIPCMSFVT